MYVESLPNSLSDRYLRYRKVPRWLANIFEVGHDHLQKAMVVPMRNVTSGRIQGYSTRLFSGSFEEVDKQKMCQDAESTVTIPRGSYRDCVVVEGVFDAFKVCQVLWSRTKYRDTCPVILNTAFPTKEQIRYIRSFDKIFIALDHDDAGERGREFLIKNLSDCPKVFDLNYPTEYKDPGELVYDDVVTFKLAFGSHGLFKKKT